MGLLQRREGGAGKGLCPQLEDKGRGNPSDNPVSKSRPSGTWRERATLGQQRCSPHRSGRSNERVRLMRALKSAGPHALTVEGKGPTSMRRKCWPGRSVPQRGFWWGGGFSALLLRPRGRADSRGAPSLEEKHHSSLPFFFPFFKSLSGLPETAGLLGSFCCLSFLERERAREEEQERGREERRGQC